MRAVGAMGKAMQARAVLAPLAVRLLAAAGLSGALSAPVAAHPHIFIDAGIEVRFDAEGRVEALRIIWVYDDFTSLLILEDRGLDPDGDGVLTAAEQAALTGFDMNWDPGFAGDTHALVGDVPVALGGPQDWTAHYAEGRVITTHLRRLSVPLRPAEAPLVVQVYDPGYYTAYGIAAAPLLKGGTGCAAQVFGPDVEAARAGLEAALAEFTGDVEADFPAVGALWAEEVRVTCAASR